MSESLSHSRFPARLPIILFGIAAATSIFIFIAPPIIKAHRIRKEILLNGKAPTWFGYAFFGQCLFSVRLIHPQDHLVSQNFSGLPADQIVVILRADNSRGTTAITINTKVIRFYTTSGSSISNLPLTDAPGADKISIPAGATPKNITIHFSRQILQQHLEQLQTLQLQINKTTLNIPGLYYSNPAIADSRQQEYQARIKLFPVRQTIP